MEHKISLFDYCKIFRDYLVILIKRFYIVVGVIFCFLIIAFIYIKTTPRVYVAESLILPMGGGGGEMGIGARLTAQFVGMSMGGEVAERFKVFLESKALSERVARRLDLHKIYKVPTIESAASIILGNSKLVMNFNEGQGIRWIVEDQDPQLVAMINRTYLSELQSYINENSFTDAKRQRVYIEKQLIQRRKEFLELGKETSKFYRKNQVSAVASVIDVEVTPNFMVNETNMETLRQDIENIQNQLDFLEKQEGNNMVMDVPQQVYLEYLKQKKYELTRIVALLSQQYEMAKMEEVKEDIAFQVIDEARIPSSPARPNVKVILSLSIFLGFFAGVFCVFLLELISRMKKETT